LLPEPTKALQSSGEHEHVCVAVFGSRVHTFPPTHTTTDFEATIHDNNPVAFAGVLIELAGIDFALAVSTEIGRLRSAASGATALPLRPAITISAMDPATGSRQIVDPLPALVTGGRRRRGKDAKEAALLRTLALETYFTSAELELMLQEFRDLSGEEPLNVSHARMWFTQHGFTPRMIELVVRVFVAPLPCGTPGSQGDFAAACIRVLSSLERSSNDERMTTFFRLFDLNGDGMLDSAEVRVLSDVLLEQFTKASGNRRSDERARAAIDTLL
jgi:hypothetical protein